MKVIINPLVHEPVRPAREGFLGEGVFLRVWQELNAKTEDTHEPFVLETILHSMPVDVNQRHATVAASFICWLGTNCGMGFIYESRNKTKWKYSEANFLGHWANENYRLSYMNGGVRPIEAFLSPEVSFTPHGCLSVLPSLSTDDYEVVEHMVFWLGSVDGLAFIDRCEEEIEKRKKQLHSVALEEFKKRYNSEKGGA